MKRLTALFLTVAMLLLLPACAPDEPDTPDVPDIPSIGDESDSTSDTGDVGAEYDEIEYHRALGMTIIESNHDYFGHYDMTTYEGLYQKVVDGVYRTKLDIEILRESGYTNPDYDELYLIVTAFLEDKEPKCLQPKSEDLLRLKMVGGNWDADIYYLADIDEARVVADERLMAFRTYYAKRRVLSMPNYIENLQADYPLICEAIFGTPPVIEGQRFDPETCYTLIDVTADPDAYLVYHPRFDPAKADTRYSVLGKNRTIELSPAYSGPIYVAELNANGTYSEAAVFEVQSAAELISAEEVSFVSPRLEGAVRTFLGKDKAEPITKAELAAVTSLRINDKGISVNNKTISEEPFTEADTFSFEDINHFACLNNLTVENISTGNPYGNVFRTLYSLYLFKCGVTDISALEGSSMTNLLCPQNQITDASVLSTFTSVEDVMFINNPLEKIALPDHGMAQVILRDTPISDLAFFDTVPYLWKLDLTNTKITDASVLAKFTALTELYLPAGVDYSFIKNFPELKELTVGGESVELD